MAKGQRLTPLGCVEAGRVLAPLTMFLNRIAERVMLEQLPRVASYITLIALFFFVASTIKAEASWTIEYMDTDVVATTTGQAYITVTWPTAIIGNSFWRENYVRVLPSDNNYHNKLKSEQCYPLSGGTGGFTGTSTTYKQFANQTQTSNTSGGATPCNVTGNYYHIYRDTTASSTILYVARYNYNAEQNRYFDYDPQLGISFNSPIFSSQYNTRFTNLTFSTTTSTTSISVGFYIDPTEATTTQADKNATMVRYRYSKNPLTEVSAYSREITDAVAPQYGNGTTTLSLPLDANSTYDFTIGFGNAGTAMTGVAPFPLAYVYFQLTTNATGGISTTTSVQYYSAVTEQGIEYQPCGITDIGGCINNAFMYLFIPSTESVQEFADLSTELQGRFPFVYAYQVPELWSTLYNTTQSHTLSVAATTTIGTITFISENQLEQLPLASTMRTIMAYVLWLMLAITLYAQVRRIFSHSNQTV